MRALFFVIGVALTWSALVQGDLLPIAPGNPLPGVRALPGSIWPKPKIYFETPEFVEIDTANFDTVLYTDDGSPLECPGLDWVQGHYKQLIRSLKPANASKNSHRAGIFSTLTITVKTCNPEVDVEKSDDEYARVAVALDGIGKPTVFLNANSFWGVIRGLESFYQMLWPADETYDVYNINQTVVEDQPRFIHRGVMIDTARHYQPESVILQVLDGMMYSKFNVLHWHIVDDQSFPYVSTKFPELSEKGAYHKNAVYTPETIKRIQKEARNRGIRVMLEFDTPGHTDGFGKSHPEFLTPCHGESTSDNGIQVSPRINFDPSNEKMYEFMHEFFAEVVANVTNDKYIHLGMDEVYGECWETSPVIQEFMKEHNYTSWREVQGHYTRRHISMVKSLNITPVAWQDPMDDGVELDKDVVIHIWKFYESLPWRVQMKKALDAGHKVLFSACWYVNLINYGQSWKEYYNCEPVDASYEDKKDQILGGEAAIWGEFVDQSNIIARLFPAASAVGAVLWNERKDMLNTNDAMWRMHDFRCKLLRRGIRAQPLLCGYCGPFEVDLDL